MVVSEAVRPERLAEAWGRIEAMVAKTLAIVGEGELAEVRDRRLFGHEGRDAVLEHRLIVIVVEWHCAVPFN